MKVLVINQYSTNKGDRAVLFFVLRELARNGVDQITVSTSNPEYWKDKPDIPKVAVRFIPWGWDTSRRKDVGFLGKVIHRVWKIILPRQVYFPLVRRSLILGKRPWYLRLVVNRQYLDAVEQADLVLSTGGHHVANIIVPDATSPQIFDMAVALLWNKPLVLWSQSIGPLDFKPQKSNSMIQKILSGANRIFIRDKVSTREIQKMGVSLAHVSQTYESVFGLCDVVQSRIKPSERPRVMGVSIWSAAKLNNEKYDSYVRCFVTLVDHAVAAGYKVRFFPMELTGADRPCLEAIINSVEKKENCEIVEGFPGTLDHINAIAQCRMFVGHKTHSQIFSLVAATPLIAIAYHKKTEDFMTQFGLYNYCIADAQLSGAKLVEMFDKVNNNLDAISQKQEEVGRKLYAQIKKDFAEMIEDTLARCR